MYNNRMKTCNTCWKHGKGPKVEFPTISQLRAHIRSKHLRMI